MLPVIWTHSVTLLLQAGVTKATIPGVPEDTEFTINVAALCSAGCFGNEDSGMGMRVAYQAVSSAGVPSSGGSNAGAIIGGIIVSTAAIST